MSETKEMNVPDKPEDFVSNGWMEIVTDVWMRLITESFPTEKNEFYEMLVIGGVKENTLLELTEEEKGTIRTALWLEVFRSLASKSKLKFDAKMGNPVKMFNLLMDMDIESEHEWEVFPLGSEFSATAEGIAYRGERYAYEELRKNPSTIVEDVRGLKAAEKGISERIFRNCVAMGLYSPVILKEMGKRHRTLPSYIIKTIPDKILKIAEGADKSAKNEINAKLQAYYLEKAIRVLEGYRNCDVPMSKDPRARKDKANLLSDKGERLLRELRRDRERNAPFSGKFLEKVKSAGHPLFLDLDLFMDLEFGEYEEEGLEAYPSDGCANRCSHCGDGKLCEAPIAHMPYPMYLKMLRKAYEEGKDEEAVYLYGTSDPLSYEDGVMGADMGDVILYNRIHYVRLCVAKTKGVYRSSEKSKARLAKIVVAEKYNNGLYFSLVNVSKEKSLKENLLRIGESLEIFRLFDPKGRCWIHLYEMGKELSKYYPDEKSKVLKDEEIAEVLKEAVRYVKRHRVSIEGNMWLNYCVDKGIKAKDIGKKEKGRFRESLILNLSPALKIEKRKLKKTTRQPKVKILKDILGSLRNKKENNRIAKAVEAAKERKQERRRQAARPITLPRQEYRPFRGGGMPAEAFRG